MGLSTSRMASALAIAAAISLTASPAMARDRWRDRDDGISAGDVLAGVLIIGGIAAIASAASKADRDDDYRDDNYRSYPEGGYREPSQDYGYREPSQDYGYRRPDTYGSSYRSGGIDNAVNMCVDQVERGQDRVASVDNTARTADGWRISGQLQGGSGFNCWIDNAGRIRNVDLGSVSYDEGDYGGSYGSYQGSSSGQYDDETYARARAGTSADYNYGVPSGDANVDADLGY